jgi:glycosyltransferase involved in cell wall biosynthesis
MLELSSILPMNKMNTLNKKQKNDHLPYFSVVVPVLNEQDNVAFLHKEILVQMKGLKKSFEIVFVNDGSSDNTLNELKKLKPIKIIDLRKNSGQSAALDAGIKQAKGEIIITLDGDGQNDPADIPNLIKKLDEGFDVVCGWRHKRRDNLTKRFVSHWARLLRSFLVGDGIHDSGCTLRACRKECFEDLDLYGEMHRMIPSLLKWRGFKIAEIKVNHRPRTKGKTKYNWKRTVKGFVDMLEIWFWRKYETRPLHLFGATGLALIGLSFLFLFYLAVRRLFFNYSLSDKIWPLVAITGIITGIQLLAFGLLADLTIKNRTKKDFYKIREIIERS